MRDDEDGSPVGTAEMPEPKASAARQPPRIRVFDPKVFRDALDGDDDFDDSGFCGPSDERPRSGSRVRTVEGEVWAGVMRKIIADPREGYRRLLVGDEAMVRRVRHATATMPHFGAVVGIIERAVVTSARTGTGVRFPPILMLSDSGLGKSHLARVVATALGTTVVPIALNATLDRGQLGGSAQAWRGAKLGKLAKAILFDCETASPIYLLDEIDKCSRRPDEDVSSVLLSALEPENARAFIDEYIDIPVRLDQALWLASANVVETISPPLLSRLLVVEVPKPSREQARLVIGAIAAATVDCPLDAGAIDLLTDMTPRNVRKAMELAHPFMVCAGRQSIAADDMRRAIALVDVGRPRSVIGFTR